MADSTVADISNPSEAAKDAKRRSGAKLQDSVRGTSKTTSEQATAS